MRQIKFRVWDNVDYMSSPFTLKDLIARRTEFTSDCPVMQFTGLTDKNGKEIYEGDIVSIIYWHNNAPSKRPKQEYVFYNLPVVFNDGKFHLDDSSIRYSEYGTTYGEWNDANIIGNIYENPELLNSDQNVQVSDTTDVK